MADLDAGAVDVGGSRDAGLRRGLRRADQEAAEGWLNELDEDEVAGAGPDGADATVDGREPNRLS